MTRPIANINQIQFLREIRHGDKFEAKLAPVSLGLGAKKLGYNVTAVPPGKRAFPFHNHHINEEMFLVLHGSGRIRLGKEEHEIGPGDIICCPPGGPDVAHQIINTGTEELRYLAVSTMIDTDVFQYPDSGKFGVAAGRTPGMRVVDAAFGGFFRESGRVEYYDGE
jgi:uncharacterized cupin superfamily protein